MTAPTSSTSPHRLALCLLVIFRPKLQIQIKASGMRLGLPCRSRFYFNASVRRLWLESKTRRVEFGMQDEGHLEEWVNGGVSGRSHFVHYYVERHLLRWDCTRDCLCERRQERGKGLCGIQVRSANHDHVRKQSLLRSGLNAAQEEDMIRGDGKRNHIQLILPIHSEGG